MLRIERYGNSRFWALYDGQALVVVTVYKRGAQEVRRRLAAQPPAAADAAAQAAAVAAAMRQAQALAAPARVRARQAQAAAQAARARAQPASEAGAAGGVSRQPSLAAPPGQAGPLQPAAAPSGSATARERAPALRWPRCRRLAAHSWPHRRANERAPEPGLPLHPKALQAFSPAQQGVPQRQSLRCQGQSVVHLWS